MSASQLPRAMTAVVFREHGGVEKLRLEEVAVPQIGPRDCLVRVRAVSLNGFDPMILARTTELKTPLPMIPGGDCAGEIAALGAQAGGQWRIGDRVCPHPFVAGEGMTGETRLGACAEYIRFPVDNLIRTPDGIEDCVAASLPIAYGTAYRMMLTRGAVRKGERVLILAATGGVGTGCIQLAKSVGAEVIACGSSEWKLTKLKKLGADHAIDASQGNWWEAVQAIAGKPRLLGSGGVDVVVNYIGGETWGPTLRVVRPGGRVLVCGATLGHAPITDLRYLWSYEISVIGSNGWLPGEQRELLALVAQGRIRPVIDAVRPLGETPASMQDLIDRRVFGKIVLTP